MRVITRTAILCGAVCIGMSVPSVSADDFYLVQGGKIEGVVQNPTQPADGKYVLEIPAGGRLVLAEQQVERVVKKSDLERRYGAMLQRPAISIWPSAAGKLVSTSRDSFILSRSFGTIRITARLATLSGIVWSMTIGFDRIDGWKSWGMSGTGATGGCHRNSSSARPKKITMRLE